MKKLRYTAWVAVAVGVLLGGVLLVRSAFLTPLSEMPFAVKIGGPFTLTTHTGERLSAKDLKGKPFAIFFGFTFCPEVCPTTLLELTQAIEQLGAEADKMRFLFVSVDHERDTPDHLKTYISNFDKRIVGLTGTAEEIAAIAKAYRVYFKKVPTEGSYTIDHTATTYLMGRKGQMVSTLAYQEKPETRLAKLRGLIRGTR